MSVFEMGLSDFWTEFSRFELGPTESSYQAIFNFIYIKTHAQSQNIKLCVKRPSWQCLAFLKKIASFHSVR